MLVCDSSGELVTVGPADSVASETNEVCGGGVNDSVMTSARLAESPREASNVAVAATALEACGFGVA
jgi:hypothetical protein